MSKINKWNIKETDRKRAKELAEKLKVSPLITGILLNRGFSEEKSMQEFLFGKEQPFYDPLFMKDLEKAADRIILAVKNQEKIAVFGDYDVDGITASSLLYLYFSELGADVITYIPKRKEEGYGLNVEALNSLAASGINLIVTVDCGISGVKEVAQAPESLEIIITDHHRVPEIMPDAYALVNPHRSDCAYPFEDLSGVGVAFKLCQAINKMIHPEAPLWEKYTELVALGTVADIVPLRDENRELVKKGLRAMANTELYGLQELIRVSGCDASNITSEDIGFRLAPRLNAVGRLEHAQRAVELFVAKDRETAREIAEELNTENSERQQISSAIQKEAEEMLSKQEKIETAIVLASEGWHPGVIGIVASRLVDKYHLPTILLSIDGETAKGSCRSIQALDLYDAINACSEDLIQFGGHRQAAGLTAEKSKVDDFRRHFKEAVNERLVPEDYIPELDVDVLMEEGDVIDMGLLEELQYLEPCGCENSTPVFSMKNASMMRPRCVGRDDKHLQFYLAEGKLSYQCIMWNGGDFSPSTFDGMAVDAAFKPKINSFRGKNSVNFQILSFISHNEIYDYRSALEDKGEILKNLARTRPGLCVFVGKESLHKEYCAQLQEMQEKGAIRLFNYEEAFAEASEEKIEEGFAEASSETSVEAFEEDFIDRIFHDIPEDAEGKKEAVLFDIPTERLVIADKNDASAGKNRKKDRRLFLLYNKKDYGLLLSLIEQKYPDRKKLAHIYIKLSEFLKDRGPSDEMAIKSALLNELRDVKGEGLDVEDKRIDLLIDLALEIFTELNFFKREGDKIIMGSSEKRDLMESKKFSALFRKKKVLEGQVKENVDGSPEDIIL